MSASVADHAHDFGMFHVCRVCGTEDTLMTSVTDVLGNSLPVTHYYGDGSYDCPHCHYPIRADQGLGPCRNPWCIANPQMPADAARKMLDKWATEKREREERERNHRFAMERIEQWHKSQNEERTRKLQAAAEQGYCVRCLVKSGFRKEIRHRKPCPREVN